jgi:imidazolonepropionase-like amidohydrolase
MMVEAELTPMQAVVAATGRAAACWASRGSSVRSSRGPRPDLLVLNANPLEAITNTRSFDAVYIGGRRFEPPPPR